MEVVACSIWGPVSGWKQLVCYLCNLKKKALCFHTHIIILLAIWAACKHCLPRWNCSTVKPRKKYMHQVKPAFSRSGMSFIKFIHKRKCILAMKTNIFGAIWDGLILRTPGQVGHQLYDILPNHPHHCCALIRFVFCSGCGLRIKFCWNEFRSCL